MIKRLHKHLFSALAVLSFMFIHTSCVEHLDESVYEPTDYVAFKASLSGETKSVPTKGFTGNLDFEEEDWVVELYSGSETKAKLYNSLNGLDAGVYGYVYSEDLTIDTRPVTDINGHKYIFDGDQLDAEEPIRWNKVDAEATDGDKFRAFVYAPKDAVSPSYQNGTSATGVPVIKIADIVSCQKDIVVADKEIVIDKTSKSHRKQIPLDFEHIFTAVQFKAGFDCTITSISISGLKTAGDYVIGSGWDNTTSTDFNLPLNKQLSKGDIIDPILMIPQKFGEGAQINLIINGDTSKPLTADLNGVEWRQGKKITYTLMTGAREYIYLDLAAGDVNITGNSYTGYVFDNKDLKEVKGTIQSGQKYYIYQSCTQNESCPNYMIGFSGDTFTKPKYDPVKGPDGRLWSDYITNNTSVENVIEAWDNKTGATDNTEIDNTKAVRKVGRESTKNHISVSGNIGDCFMVIDNIYSSYQQASVSRTTGGIAYTPGKDSNLTINLIGDNRVGCVHYTNTSTDNHNQLIFDGEGSLTVADTDFNTESHNGTEYPGVENMGERTYFSNHWCSAIGGNDSGSSQEVYGIVINGGTIFAGTTKAENCTAIGGGGNGHGQVTINGGSVTAVATTTGTAIGGGIGYNSAGGSGNVKITGGNVYAYNYANRWEIPSSAIGGAGSRKASGSTGIVTIEAGSIYAYSALGTAIGGGSSAWNTAGKGIVNINGGTIIAKSGDKNSAGIGGGSAYTEKYEAGNTKNGGDAEITITGNPVIRTGSIGGGSPGSGASYGGTIGSAKITVTGGDIQAQFVMADSDNNVFNMEGGVIRNSSTSDNEYYCIQPNGGAVYMEKGTFTMSGGIIKECTADKTNEAKGGAVYITGDPEKTEFTMSGGTIRECKANSDGGAVYLEGGKVTISGGTIEGNVAYKGNGGAICILGGDFTMNGGLVNKNAAFGSGTTGNGGGIYVAPASSTSSDAITVKLTKGGITSNSADQNGGGVCVDMGTNSAATLNVTVGTESDIEVPVTNNPDIEANSALIEGGGMYVNGAKANVTLNDGNILNNETSSYQVNPDMSVDGGMVTLKKPGITTQVTITFSNNALYYTQGATSDTTKEQYIVAASNSKLDANEFGQINDYYNDFKGWNTRQDGTGTTYTDKQIVSLNENITLYAQWE